MPKKLPAGTIHKLPVDIREAILADKKMLAIWEDNTPLARNEWICGTTNRGCPKRGPSTS